MDFTTRSSSVVTGCRLFGAFDDLGNHIKLVELRHDVDASCPGLELVNQLDRHLYPNLDSIIPRLLDPFARFIGDRNARDFIMKEVRMSCINKRQDANYNRLFQFSTS